MRLNSETIIIGKTCSLVPYTKDLVETYHDWFLQDPTLLDATGSELLSLEEEYSNQESWRENEAKLTFLIKDFADDTLCGDVNCFFSPYFVEDYSADFEGEGEWIADGLVGELNLMVARKESRRKGIARESAELMIKYILENIPKVRVFVAKIQLTNEPSIALFKMLGFREFKRVDCFGEIHFIKEVMKGEGCTENF